MSYNFNEIEAKWQKYWEENQTFKASNNSEKPKFYGLDMFPYPSGAGLHVGHPLGYIASDIVARYKRHQGFNVLHPQGYDSFGLPAEQYAIQTGQHPADTTEINIEGCLDEKQNILKKYLNDDGSIKKAALIKKRLPTNIDQKDYQDNIIKGYRNQLDKIGFSFDWSREVRTSDPNYYKWTQWIFIQLFECWYDNEAAKARPIAELIEIFLAEGNTKVNAVCDDEVKDFSAAAWSSFSDKEQQEILLQYRLTYLAETEVNWCPELGTVLANDEIVNGVSERGGHPVVRKKMKQWSMRISAYAERLLQGLENIDWTESLKETQRNWIGKSVGASVTFNVQDHEDTIEVFTTRPDTIFGVTFMTLAPEHELVSKITTPAQKEAVENYIQATAKRSERERMADVKTISGVFTGAYAEHPFTKESVPVWIGDYVLAGYGTGAVMAVPCGDQRDYDFAKHFDIPIKNIFKDVDISEEAHAGKDGTVITNSDFLNGLTYKKALKTAIYELEKLGQGEGKTNYRLRDAVFSRQRYWGEPFPVYYVNGMPQMIEAKHLPIRLPEVEKYLPTQEGEPPLGRADVWAWDAPKNEVVNKNLVDHETVFPLELNTMPGWAGSSWYFFRYMENEKRDDVFASAEAMQYWQNVDLYIGGSEHATGHLLYARFWTKFLKDRNLVPVEEPFKKLINQGMILGESAKLNKAKLYVGVENDYQYDIQLNQYIFNCPGLLNISETFFVDNFEQVDNQGMYIEKNKNIDTIKSKILEYIEKFPQLDFSKLKSNLKEPDFNVYYEVRKTYLPIEYIDNGNSLKIYEYVEILKNNSDVNVEYELWIDDDGKTHNSSSCNLRDISFKVYREVEKMSKSKYNVVNPDDICKEYGADTLRMYEMFLGPLEQAKPWNTAGITGVHNFLKKLWKLYHNGEAFLVNDEKASPESLKTLHKTIKKVTEDIEEFSFNTSVSTFMICVNELAAQKCNSREVLEPLAILISPYAPHIAEELWSLMGHQESIATASYPQYEEKFLVESTKTYPVSFNGKMRFTLDLSLDLSKDEIEKAVMEDARTQKQLDGRTPKKVIIVPGKIVNIVR